MLVLMTGLPGTGKTSIAEGLSRRVHGAVVLDKDRVRLALFTHAAISYTREQDDFCGTILLETAAFLLHRDPNRTIILDGRTCTRTYQVEQVEALATRLDQPLAVIACSCSDDIARQRLQADAGHHPARNRTYALYQQLQATAQPLTRAHLRLDTTVTPISDCVDACMHYLEP